MNSNESNQVESLIQQLKFKTPSGRLDQAIFNLEATVVTEDEPVSHARRTSFGWPAILSIAVASMLAGLLLGNFFANRAPTSSTLASVSARESELLMSNATMITDVNFNVSAFRLLHGHSQKPEYSNCDKCHQVKEGETVDQAFEDWFYGDHHFFEKHHNHGFGTCSNCHELDGEDAAKEQQEAGWHKQFVELANCAKCHQTEG